MPPVYLDNHATTPVDPRVLDAMLPYFTEVFGNPASSVHQFGWRAQEAVEQARREVATLIGASAREITFTSGATESNNLAIAGAGDAAPHERRHIVVSAIEHKSVLESAARLGTIGWSVTELPVQADGLVDLVTLRNAVTPATALVSIMAANNEIGVVQPLAEIGAIVRARGCALSCRCRPGRGQSADRRRRDADRFAGADRAQDVRAKRLRRALRPQAHGADAADSRRRPGARPALGHPQRAGHRRSRKSVRHLPRGNGRRDAQSWRAFAIDCSRDSGQECPASS